MTDHSYLGHATYLTKKQLEKLPTPRLLAYKKKHFSRFGLYFSILDGSNPCDCVVCKEFREARHNCIAVLATREHITKRSKK